MTSTFTPPVAPSIGGKKKIDYRIKNSGFGDNYVQRAADGINTKGVAWDLNWAALSPANAAVIESFFDGVAGYQAFYYTVTGDIQRKYIASGFSRNMQYGQADSISITLTQVFDP